MSDEQQEQGVEQAVVDEAQRLKAGLVAALAKLKAKRADLIQNYAETLIAQGSVTQHAEDFLDAITRTDRHVAAMEALLE